MQVSFTEVDFCYLFDHFCRGTYDEIQKKASYGIITSNWKKFTNLRTRLRYLVRERNLENVMNFSKMTYGRYLSLVENTYLLREYKLVVKIFPATSNSKFAWSLQLKFENCIVDDIMVMDYLIFLIEEGKERLREVEG